MAYWKAPYPPFVMIPSRCSSRPSKGIKSDTRAFSGMTVLSGRVMSFLSSSMTTKTSPHYLKVFMVGTIRSLNFTTTDPYNTATISWRCFQ